MPRRPSGPNFPGCPWGPTGPVLPGGPWVPDVPYREGDNHTQQGIRTELDQSDFTNSELSAQLFTFAPFKPCFPSFPATPT